MIKDSESNTFSYLLIYNIFAFQFFYLFLPSLSLSIVFFNTFHYFLSIPHLAFFSEVFSSLFFVLRSLSDISLSRSILRFPLHLAFLFSSSWIVMLPLSLFLLSILALPSSKPLLQSRPFSLVLAFSIAWTAYFFRVSTRVLRPSLYSHKWRHCPKLVGETLQHSFRHRNQPGQTAVPHNRQSHPLFLISLIVVLVLPEHPCPSFNFVKMESYKKRLQRIEKIAIKLSRYHLQIPSNLKEINCKLNDCHLSEKIDKTLVDNSHVLFHYMVEK